MGSACRFCVRDERYVNPANPARPLIPAILPLEWLVADGETVREGNPLFRIETDKVETEINAPASGVVRWTAEPGQPYPVGTRIGYIETT